MLFLNYDHRYGTGTLTHVFLDHVFQECLTFEGEMVRFSTLFNTESFPFTWTNDVERDN